MDAADIDLRNVTYRLFVTLGRAPAVAEVAGSTGLPEAEVLGGWRRLHDAHALFVDWKANQLRMAAPFSAVPTRHRVWAEGRWWHANCAWDAFGVIAALGTDGRVESACPDCGEGVAVAVAGGRAEEVECVFHTLLPAAAWWDDIVFT